MQKKQMLFKTKGMNQDLSVSAFNSEFAFENMNLRLSTNEGNTMMSWVNEKGTAALKKEEITPEYWSKDEEEDVYVDPQDDSWTYHAAETTYVDIILEGIPVGTAVLNHKLIVFFAAASEGNYDYIYEFEVANKDEHQLTVKMLYEGFLNLSAEHPIETLASYESKEAQKVYWTDYYNQPRLINIAKYEETARQYDPREEEGDPIIIDTIFDFIRTVVLNEQVEITKTEGSGVFAPGVIQYCLAYYNKYGQQTNIVYVSPLCYLAHKDRGASPEEKVSCTFKIKVKKIDENFEYLRLYSVQRTSLNADPIVRIVTDLKVAGGIDTTEGNENYKYLDFVDNGVRGTAMDPTELLFIGGKPIKVLTMAEKDQTLFMGNIKQDSLDISKLQDYILGLEHLLPPTFYNSKEVTLEEPNTFYPYKNSLGGSNNNEDITTFKGGEWYRFGFQLQRKTGEWSEPIYIGDVYNDKYPQKPAGAPEKIYELVQAQKYIPLSNIAAGAQVSLDDYVKIRPVVVFPNVAERSVLCQGVLNPTVFNVEDRISNSPYSQASWFFRPYALEADPTTKEGREAAVVQLSTNAEFTHYASLPSHKAIDIYKNGTQPNQAGIINAARNIEIQGSKDKYTYTDSEIGTTYPSVFGSDNEANTNNQFFVDQSIVTLNSPEIDFDPTVQSIGTDALKLRIVGYINIDSTASSHIITTNSNKSLAAQNMTVGDDQHVVLLEGDGETDINVFYNVSDGNGKGSRMISGNYWNDGCALDGGIDNLTIFMFRDDPNYNAYPGTQQYQTDGDGREFYTTHAWPVNFFVHPWHASRSLNNDWRASGSQSSNLKTKRLANLLYSYNTKYFSLDNAINYEDISSKLHLQENEQIYKMTLPKQKESFSEISYYPNIDKVLYNENYYPLFETASDEPGKQYDLLRDDVDHTEMLIPVNAPVEMKYKSTSHALIAFNAIFDEDSNIYKIPILPYLLINGGTEVGGYIDPPTFAPNYNTFWGDTGAQFSQQGITLSDFNTTTKKPCVLWLGELYRNVEQETIFGGKTKEAIKNNTWLIGGEAVDISSDPLLIWNQGDTYYQRYDCLKTYPFTKEDKNQLIEILSFMCETHVNIDGRYDANRGSTNNVNVSPQNFNLINDVYSQLNNFFTSRQISSESVQPDYPNVIVYSKTKSSASDVDAWTNVTLASTLELDGSKGQITSLNRFNDQIIAFQDRAISQVLYNENVQISSTQGVPIEIANSGKVQGKRYLSDFIGCSNKWSVVRTPAGIYFMDSNNKGIYMFDGTVKNISGTLGFNTWCKNNISISKDMWNPKLFNDFVSYYDAQNQEVLFINKETCLAYSEKLGAFTSFYSYENTPYFCNLDDLGVWIKHSGDSNSTNSYLYHHQAGDYGKFFGVNKPYWVTLVGNPEPQIDKLFTNLEFRACVDGDGINSETGKFTPTLPFNSLETWNEYQHGKTTLENKNGMGLFNHGGDSSALIRKFRIWRCDIPRDNFQFMTYPVKEEEETEEEYQERVTAYNEWLQGEQSKGIYRVSRHVNDRMRNPWLYLKLFHQEAATDETLDRAEIHDIVMDYFE